MEVINNCPPVAGDATITVPVNEIYQGTFEATDPEGDPLTFRVLPNVTTGIVSLVDATTGAFTYAPTSLEDDKIQFIANDGLSDSNVGEITIKISTGPTCDTTAFPITIDVSQGKAFEGTLHGEDASGNPLTYSIVSGPSSGNVSILDAANGQFSYFPNNSFNGDSFTYKVNNGICDSTPAIVTVKKSSAPICSADSINVLKNVTHSGAVSCSDPDNDNLTYSLVSQPTRGTLTLNPSTGSYTYTPVTDAVGPDSFVYNASDGVHTAKDQTVTINIIGSCPTGGIYKGIDSDSDGYVDYLEVALGSDPESVNSTPADIDPQTLNVSFNDDYDGDGYKDYIEMWMQADPADATSIPEYAFDSCFDSTSDGIKPRLIGFNIDTPVIDMSSGQTSAVYSMTLLDNASGIKRARVSLLSPSGVFVTTSASFTSYPLLTGLRLSTDPLSQFAEEGTWTISGITLFDEAANRLDLTANDLQNAGFATTIDVVNLHSDTSAPVLEDFTILTSDIVYAGTENKRMSVSLTLSDDSSGVASARVDFISASGTIVSASKTLAQNPLSTTIQLDTDLLSSHLEDGQWTVYNVLLVDAAGNSVQAVDQLDANSFAKTLTVTNPNSDAVPPTLESFSILTPEVFPLNGDARMSFAVTAYDTALNMNGNDPSGVAKIRIDITGPAGQKLIAWGYFSAPYSSMATIQIDTATLSTLTQEGAWYVSGIEVFDEAGNSTIYYAADLSAYPTEILVSR